MADRTEWIRATDIRATVGPHEDAFGNRSENALLIDSGSGTTVAIEGTSNEILFALVEMIGVAAEGNTEIEEDLPDV